MGTSLRPSKTYWATIQPRQSAPLWVASAKRDADTDREIAFVTSKLKSAVKSWLAPCGLLTPVAVITRRLRINRRRHAKAAKRHAKAAMRQFCRKLPERVAHPFFVKVGANDGLSGDACSDILLAMHAGKGC